MNAYFENNGSFDSNSRIIEAYFSETVKPVSRARRMGESLISLLSALITCLTSAKTRSIAKAVSVALSLVGFVGIIGAMEHGTLSIGMGLLIGVGLLGIEYLCLRKRQV